MKHFLSIFLVSLLSFACIAQETVLKSLAHEYKHVVPHVDGHFEGEAWSTLLTEIRTHNHVLIGEDHHINEVLDFTQAIAAHGSFDNYITESDQATLTRMAALKTLDSEQYRKKITPFREHLGFYRFEKDNALLDYFWKEGIQTFGIDQVFFNGDVFLYDHLMELAQTEQAKLRYQELKNRSLKKWTIYKENPNQNPPYSLDSLPLLFDADLSLQLNELLLSASSFRERELLEELLLSNEIYSLSATPGKEYDSHEKRISAMKKKLITLYPALRDKRNLYKFGANHVTKYKSMWQNMPDVGNLVYNLADSEYGKSLHLAIIQRQGEAGSFFGDKQQTNGLSFLKPFYDVFTETHTDSDWLMFDLRRINQVLRKQKVTVESAALRNFLEGYDFLVIFPTATAQKKL